jgi:[ribosomal protein S5]-alanine N-acetyltransferase
MLELRKPLILDRFYLRHLSISDATETYLSWFKDPKAIEFIDYAQNNSELNDLRIFIEEKNASKKSLFFGIFTIRDNIHIGNIKFEPIDFEQKKAEMGILIGNSIWRGRGAGPEVITGSGRWLKDNYNIKTMTLGVAINNERAVTAYKKIGFILNQPASLHEEENSLRMTLDLNNI